MENQGYRKLSQEEIDLINEIKQAGVILNVLCEKLYETKVEKDMRWIAIGRTKLQEGLMALTRGVAKPMSF